MYIPTGDNKWDEHSIGKPFNSARKRRDLDLPDDIGDK
jgi:hypothetical protein